MTSTGDFFAIEGGPKPNSGNSSSGTALGRVFTLSGSTGSYDMSGDTASSEGVTLDRDISNRPIHPALVGNRPSWFNTPIQRGRMIRYYPDPQIISFGNGKTPGIVPVANSKKVIFNFVFNPTSINMGYDADPEALGASNYSDPAGDTALKGGIGSVSFELLIDRHLEVIEGTSPRGLLDDVEALKWLGAMRSSTSGTEDAPMDTSPIEVRFGGSRSFHFWGFFTNLNLALTHFTADMIPTRGAISVSMARKHDVVDSMQYAQDNFFEIRAEINGAGSGPVPGGRGLRPRPARAPAPPTTPAPPGSRSQVGRPQ